MNRLWVMQPKTGSGMTDDKQGILLTGDKKM